MSTFPLNQANPASAPNRRMNPNSAMPDRSAENRMSMSEMNMVKKQKMARMYSPSLILILELFLFGI